jgi:hypothetical protein
VIDEHAVEEVLVAVLEGGQSDVFLERVGLARDVRVGPAPLLLEGADGLGEKAFEPERASLLRGEGSALGVEGVAEQRHAAARHFQVRIALAVPREPEAFHRVLLSPRYKIQRGRSVGAPVRRSQSVRRRTGTAISPNDQLFLRTTLRARSRAALPNVS